MSSSRMVARDALVKVEGGAYSHIAVPAMLRGSGLAPRERAQVTDLVYSTLRQQRRLDDLIARASKRRIARLDPPVRAVLRLGAQQLLAGVPPHAAVGETVTAAPTRARGYVNGVLRSLTRLGPPWPEPESEAVALSYPDWLVDRLGHELGPEDARAVLVAGNAPGALTLRPNVTKTDADALMAELVAGGATVTRGELVTDALIVRGAGDPATLPSVAKGRATPQDQGSQAVIRYLDPQAGDRVLDVAAAPGGKATAIGERVGKRGRVIAADTQAGRLRLVGVAARRLGLATVDLVIADGRHPPVRDASCDRVLVDAPCSGLGVLRRRPEARWRIDPETIPGLADLQVELLIAAARSVRPGGVLVYAVCTLTKAETSEVAERALERLGTFSPLAPPGEPWRPWGPGALLLPSAAGTDGMFLLGLRRDAEPGSEPPAGDRAPGV